MVVEVEGVEIVETVEETGEPQTPMPRRLLPDPVSVVPNILTCLLVNGRAAGCIIAGGSQLIFVQSRPHALGRTFSLQNQQNEIQTSSARSLVQTE